MSYPGLYLYAEKWSHFIYEIFPEEKEKEKFKGNGE